YCDGQVSADFPDPYTFVPLAHFWLCQHPDPRRVLVLGGGAEGLLAAILRHPVEQVDYVEVDPRQLELIEPYLPETDRQALTDSRVSVHHQDARYFVKTQRERFDLVIARLPEPTSAQRARFYTAEFYGELRRAMGPRSVLCMTAAASPGRLSAVSGEYLGSIRATIGKHFPHLTVGWGNPAQVLAAMQAGLVSTDPAELAARYTRRGVQADLFHPAWFDGATDWLEPGKLARRAEELDALDEVEISTDSRPCVYMQRLVLWDRMTGGRSGRVIEWLRSVGWLEVVAALVLVGGVTLAVSYVRDRVGKGRLPRDCYPWTWRGAVTVSVGTTGFVTMALSIIWLFSFQNLYGYVYQRIGWIIALFMGGLVIGCWVVNRRSQRAARRGGLSAYLWRRLVAVDVLLALLASGIPLLLPALAAVQNTELALLLVEWAVSILVALTGVLGGAAFALAGGLQLASMGEVGASAGSVVGADHAGACAGALLTGVLLVPVFGTTAAALLLVGIKLSSAGLLVLLGRRLSRAA
ncbi:MAG: spermine/spermidine synthase domain-containing protein, partial [Planctomycetota bacterium]